MKLLLKMKMWFQLLSHAPYLSPLETPLTSYLSILSVLHFNTKSSSVHSHIFLWPSLSSHDQHKYHDSTIKLYDLPHLLCTLWHQSVVVSPLLVVLPPFIHIVAIPWPLQLIYFLTSDTRFLWRPYKHLIKASSK